MIILIILAVKLAKCLTIIAKLNRHVTVQSLVSVYYALVHPYLTYGWILWGNNYEVSVGKATKQSYKNHQHCTNSWPCYSLLCRPSGLIKLPDIIKLSTCQLFYDHIADKKSSNFAFFFVSEIHDYATRSTYLQHLNPSPFRINIRKLFPTITGCYYWNDIAISIREKPTKKTF